MRPATATLAVLVAVLGVTTPGASAQPDDTAVNATPWCYVAPPFTPHCLQTYRLFVPDGTPPADGWPVLINFDLSVYAVTVDYPTLTAGACGSFQTLMTRFLDAGFAVVAARATPSWETDSGGWEMLGCDPPPALPGHGMFHPPGAVSPDVGLAPYDDPAYHMPEKDAVMIVQHVRHLARESTGASATAFPLEQRDAMAALDHRRIVVHGASAGAVSFMWSAFGPDRRAEAPFAGAGGQYAEWTRPDAAILGAGPTWLPIFDPGTGFAPFHWSAGGHSENAAGTFAGVLPDDLLGNSALAYDECAFNATLPTYMDSWFPSESTDHVKSVSPPCPPWPFCFSGQGLEDDIHAAWSMYAWEAVHPEATRLATFDATVAGQAAGLDVALVGSTLCDVLDDMVAWAQAEVVPDPWIEMDEVRLDPDDVFCTPVAVAGVAGVPQLTGTGSLLPGAPFTLSLTGAAPSAVAWLGLDFVPALVPLAGGIQVPGDTFAALLLGTNTAGELHLSAGWPFAPGTPVYFQYAIEEGAAPMGLALTRGLLANTP